MKVLVGMTHRHLFRARFALRSQNWQAAGNRPPSLLRNVIVSGYIHEALGIGEAGRLTIKALRDRGVWVAAEDLRPFDRGLLTRPPVPFDTQDADTWLIHANPPEARIALFTHDYKNWQHLYRIAYWVWESSRAPDDWAHIAKWFHEIWTPSHFSRDAIAACLDPADVSKLRVMPHPVALPELKTARSGGSFTALTMFDPRSSFTRKNPIGVIKAWLHAFPQPEAGVRLVVKTHDTAKTYRAFAALKALTGSRPDIEIMAETLSKDATYELISGSDLLISLHCGEGFGLILAEAMAAGVCVMATDDCGNREFMTKENAILVPGHIVPASPDYNGPRAYWIEPDLAFAASALREIAADENKRRHLAETGRTSIQELSTPWRSIGHITVC